MTCVSRNISQLACSTTDLDVWHSDVESLVRVIIVSALLCICLPRLIKLVFLETSSVQLCSCCIPMVYWDKVIATEQYDALAHSTVVYDCEVENERYLKVVQKSYLNFGYVLVDLLKRSTYNRESQRAQQRAHEEKGVHGSEGCKYLRNSVS
nr:hypothetical protein Iba_chr08aCG8310 [Ipomoea batatas]